MDRFVCKIQVIIWILNISDFYIIIIFLIFITAQLYTQRELLLLLLLLLLLKKVGSARLGASDLHPNSPKTKAPQYQPKARKKRKGKRVEDYIRDRAAWANKEALALLLKHASPTPSNTGLARSFQRDTEKGIKILLYYKVLQRGGA